MTAKPAHEPVQAADAAAGHLDTPDTLQCPLCLAALPPGTECELCADPGAGHEPVAAEDPERQFVSDTDPRRWGFIDQDGAFVPVPKPPLTLHGLKPPVTVQLYGGPRTIIAEPGGEGDGA